MPSTTRAGGLLVAAGLAVSTCFAMTALGAPGTEVGFPQHPSVSPDGRTIVFAWAGDLWAVSSDGGNAVRLTSHPATEGRSAFSPDGSRLVFESSRSGASNLFEVEVTGSGSDLVVGEPRRVTMSPSSQMLGGYSADGSEIYYSSFEERGIFRHPKMFAAPIDGGPVRMLAEGAHGREPRPAGDGRGILFSRGYWNWERPEYRGTGDSDVWYYNTRDGSFRQLTEFEGMDGMAYALPNGQVAYVSSRTDDNNVFRMSLRTGDDQQPRRMSAFAPEGDRATIGHGVRDFAVSASGELGVMTMWDGLYTIDLRSGNTSPQRVDVRAAADTDELDTRFLDLGREVDEMAISPDGKTVAVIARGEVFVRPAGEERPARRVTHTAARETGVTWSPDGQHLYFASNADGRSDIHRAMVTLTRESLANNDPFGDLNIQAEPQAAEDKPQTAGEASPAAGDWACITVVPEMGGEIEFTLSLSVDDANNVTGSAVVPAMGASAGVTGTFDPATGVLVLDIEMAEMTVSVSAGISGDELTGTITWGEGETPVTGQRTGGPDDEAAEEGDAGDSDDAQNAEDEKTDESKVDHGDRWAEALRFEVEPVVATEEDEYRPMVSPDGRQLMYTRSRGDIVIRDLYTGNERVVVESWNVPDISWASDSRHVVYDLADLDFNSDVYILDTAPDADGFLARPFNVTRHPDNDGSPRLSADGRVLAFVSERANQNWSFDVYSVFLDARLDGLTDYELEAYFKKADSEAKKLADPIDAIDWSSDEPFEGREAAEPLEFNKQDLQSAYLRVRSVDSSGASAGGLDIHPSGERVVYNAGSLKSREVTGGGERQVASGRGGDVRVHPKGIVEYVQGSQARSANITGGGAKTYGISAPVEIDVAQEQRQKFLEGAVQFGDFFYHPTIKGLDWPALVEAYEQLAVKTRTSGEFNRVMEMLFGEVEGSHTGVRGGGSAFSGRSVRTGYLGITAEPTEDGYRVSDIAPNSPADRPSSKLEVGDVIVAVNEQPLTDADTASGLLDLDRAMADTAGREIIVEVLRTNTDDDAESGEPERKLFLMVPMSSGQKSQLAYQNEVEQRRQLVEELSDGRLGYLHIRGMSAQYVRTFERDLYAAAAGKDGLIIDVRDNGGGSTTDILLASLTAPVHAYTVPRGANSDEVSVYNYPRDRRLLYPYQRPLTVLINENSFSNAEIFAHSIKTIGRGKLVGTRTYGGVISTGSYRLIDGTTVRRPFRGWFLPNGQDMENYGAIPDIDVPMTPADEAAGRDPQIQAAVEEMLERIDAGPAQRGPGRGGLGQ